jgi:hypothetical protein
VPKYDAFGREIGEDTLEGLGGTPDATQRPAPPRPEPAAPREAVPEPSGLPPRAEPAAPRDAGGPEAPAQPDAAARQALAGQLRDAMAQAAAARSAGPASGVVIRRSTAARGCLVAFVLTVVVVGLVVAGAALLVGGAVKSGSDALKDTIKTLPEQPAKPAAAPHGLGPRSLVRKANFAAALKKLRGSGLRLTHLRLAPGRIDVQLLTRGGSLRSVQVQPGGAMERIGPDAGPGFDSTRTIPFGRLRAGAPQRLARQGAAKLHVPVSTLQYVVPSLFSGTLTWAAYFKHSRYVIGDATGRWQRSYP